MACCCRSDVVYIPMPNDPKSQSEQGKQNKRHEWADGRGRDAWRRTSPRIHIRMRNRVRLLMKRAEEVFTDRRCGGYLAVRCEQGLSLLLRGYGFLSRIAVRMDEC